MMPFIFTLLGLASAAGLYFVFVVSGIALFVVGSPLLAAYGAYRSIHSLFTEEHLHESSRPESDIIAATDSRSLQKNRLSDEAAAEMIRIIETDKIGQLLEKLPSMNHHEMHFSREGDLWQIQFRLNSFVAHFDAIGSGASPDLAFEQVKERLEDEIREWHLARLDGRPYVSRLPEGCTVVGKARPRWPTVLIVEDDVDMAIGLRSVFQHLGCKVNVVTEMNFAHEQVSACENDFILLDWMLGDDLNGAK